MMPTVFHSHSRDLQHYPCVLIILMIIKVNKVSLHQCKRVHMCLYNTFHLLVRILHGKLQKVAFLFLQQHFENSWPAEQPLWGRRAGAALLWSSRRLFCTKIHAL